MAAMDGGRARTAVLDYLRKHRGEARGPDLLRGTHVTQGTIRRMADDGLIESEWSSYGRGSGKRGRFIIYRLPVDGEPATNGNSNHAQDAPEERVGPGRPLGSKNGTLRAKMDQDKRIAQAAEILFGRRMPDVMDFLRWVDQTKEMMNGG